MSYSTKIASAASTVENCLAEMFPELSERDSVEAEETFGDMLKFAGLPDFDWDVEMELQEQYRNER